MKLKLERPIIFFDLETTGLTIGKDHIVELCYIRLDPNGCERAETMRFNPGVHIPKESSDVHGITDEDVKDCPTFAEKAPELARVFEGCDLAGYNSNRFDVPMLAEEFAIVGIDIHIEEKKLVDVQNIFHKMEQRTLVAAYKFYCGRNLEDAHSALADTRATLEVLEAQLDRYSDTLQNDVPFLADFTQMSRGVDLACRFVYDENNVEIVNFGKYKGQRVRDVLRKDPSYKHWMLQGDFTQNTKQTLERLALKYAGK
ncbi:MAG: 3'-5' exonuclease [Bacteroidaceae bacterium]|nr:3'-5' exonuclease [Bacteroidaceae bacterium]